MVFQFVLTSATLLEINNERLYFFTYLIVRFNYYFFGFAFECGLNTREFKYKWDSLDPSAAGT